MNIFLTLFAALAIIDGLVAERPLEIRASTAESNSGYHKKRATTDDEYTHAIHENTFDEKSEEETRSSDGLIHHIEEDEFISSLNELTMEELKECIYYVAYYRKDYVDNAYGLFDVMKKLFQALGSLATEVKEISEEPKNPLEGQNLVEKLNSMVSRLKKNLGKVNQMDPTYNQSITSNRNRIAEEFLSPYKTALRSKSGTHCARHILNSLETFTQEKFAICDEESKPIWEIVRSETGKVQESIEQLTSAVENSRQTCSADDRNSNCVNQVLDNFELAEEINKNLDRVDAFWDTYKPYLHDNYVACFNRVLGQRTQEEIDDLEEDVQRCIQKGKKY